MKIVRFVSGLGNVMFQYALYLQVCKLYPAETVYVDTIFYHFTDYPFEFSRIFNKYFDNDFFNIYTKKYDASIGEQLKQLNFWDKYNVDYIQFCAKYPKGSADLSLEELPSLYKKKLSGLRIVSDSPLSIAKMEEYIKYGDRVLTRRKRLRHILENKLSEKHPVIFSFICAMYRRNGRKRFISQILHFRKPDFCSFFELSRLKQDGNVYYNLYGNPMDCEGIRDELVKAFSFRSLDEKNDSIKNAIMNSNSVAIHARIRHFQYGMGSILKRNYYKKAIKYIKSKRKEKLKYFVFSDDLKWCRENIRELGLEMNDDIVWVEGNTGDDSYKDMQLMTYCKYHIIPNSTFSWWAGYLSQRKNKIMVTPYGTLPGTISF